MRLASVLNSGESIEKAIALSCHAFRSNGAFYSGFEQVVVFYGDNLPRQGDTRRVHGTLGGLVEHAGGTRHVPHSSLDDLWEDRNAIVSAFCAEGRISERIGDKLRIDRSRFSRTVANLPWGAVYPELGALALRRVRERWPFVQFVKLDLRNSLRLVQESVPLSSVGKMYLLNPDGVVSCHAFCRLLAGARNRIEDPVKRSFVCSANVFVFIVQLVQRCCGLDPAMVIGYRHLTRFPRRAYDLAIAWLLATCSESVVEPRNVSFSETLEQWKSVLPASARTTPAVYRTLQDILA